MTTSTFLLESSPVLAGHRHCHTVLDCRKRKLWSCSCGCFPCQQVPVDAMSETGWRPETRVCEFEPQPYSKQKLRLNVLCFRKKMRLSTGGYYEILPDSGLISVPGKTVPLTMLVRAPTERGPFQRRCSLLHFYLLHQPVHRAWQSNFHTGFIFKQSPATSASGWVS